MNRLNIKNKSVTFKKFLYIGVLLTAIFLFRLFNAYTQSVQAAGNAQIINLVNNLSNYTNNKVPEFGKFELTFDVSNLSTIFPTDSFGKFTDKDLNPFNPQIADIEGVFSPPGCNFSANCTIQIPGFWYQDFTLTDTNGAPTGERVSSGQTKWKIRFSPQLTGTYQYYIKVIENNLQTGQTGNFSFDSETSANKGFVRQDTNKHYFRFDDGTAFNPVGVTLAHASVNAYPSFFAGYAANNINFSRFADGNTHFKQEWSDVANVCDVSNCPLKWYQGLGRYNLVAGYRLDQVMKLAEENGVYLEFVWGGQPDLATVNTMGVWSWANNPYNIVNGGLVSSNIDFFTNATAKNYVKRKLRYVFSRWGYSRSIFSWESVNEIDLLIVGEGWKTDTAKWQAINSWHQEMVTYLKSLDIYHHLNTGSTTVGPPKLWTANPAQNYWRAYWDLPVWDFIQTHEYNTAATTYNNIICAIDTAVDTLDVPCNNPPVNYPPNTKTLLTNHGFPMIFGEWGTSAQAFDFTEQNLHDAIWTAALNGATLVPWYGENISANGWLPRFKALSLFLQNEDLGKSNMARVRFPLVQPSQYQAYGLSNGTRILSWIINTGSTVEGSVTFPNMQGGNYVIEIWDPWSGALLNSTNTSVNNNQLVINLPAFNHSLAFKAYLTTCPLAKQGDLDCSGKVNILDLSALLSVFGSTTNKQADLDDSGKVNMIDLSILLQNFGKIQ